jgi:tetratricopeptide (TPR) repeat protein
VRTKLLAWQSRWIYILGDSVAAGALLAQSQDLLDGPNLADTDIRAERAFVLLQVGRLTSEGDYPTAHAAYEQSLALFHELGDRWGEAAVLFGLGAGCIDFLGDYDQAQQYLEQSLSLRRALDDRLGMVEALARVSDLARQRGQAAESERLAREIYEASMALGNRRTIALAASNLGSALYWGTAYEEANRLLWESAAIYTDLGDSASLPQVYQRLGVSEAFLGRFADAQATFERGLSSAQAVGSTLEAGSCLNGLTAVALANRAYSEALRFIPEAIARFSAIGERWYLSQAYAYSALAERGIGNRPQARRHAITALRSALEIPAWLITLFSLWAIALLLADDEEPERAAELYALTERELAPRDDAWSKAVARHELIAVTTSLPADVAVTAQERGRARNLWTTAQELLVELEAVGWGANQLET